MLGSQKINADKKLIRRGKIKKINVYNNKETCYTLHEIFFSLSLFSGTLIGLFNKMYLEKAFELNQRNFEILIEIFYYRIDTKYTQTALLKFEKKYYMNFFQFSSKSPQKQILLIYIF